MGEDMGLHRIFVEEKSYERLKKAKDRYGEDMHDIEWEAVESLLDEKGERKKAVLKDETLQPLLEWANELSIAPDELLTMIISWGRVFSDPRLSVMDAMKSIPELARNLGITKMKKSPS